MWPLAVFFALVIILTVAIVSLSALLGQRHRERTTDDPYESGIAPTGSARIRFDVKFYLMAMFFVIFDLEAVFIFAWANSARKLGWSGYIEMVIFVGILSLSLFYLWRVGALDWGTAAHQKHLKSRIRHRRQNRGGTAANGKLMDS
ncbi:MAG: NAD(P)H-quinone oxidoreductase subunit 3 [Deltaproteobacteria bacterium]|nr:NAD(P)H-quinone oxidoreductase subunit 3 [Deltaproteobacteria bacterium]